MIVPLLLLPFLAGGCGGAWTAFKNIRTSHPQTEVPDEPPASIKNPVRWIWSGGLTPISIRVTARLTADAGSVRLLVDTDEQFLRPRATGYRAVTEVDDHRIVTFDIDGLTPATAHVYALEIDGEIDRVRMGRFRTPPAGPASFTVAFGACARTGSDGEVFETIRRHRPLVLLHAGDLHYDNITTPEIGRFLRSYERVLTAPAQARLYRAVPVAYVWDDHDYCGNDSHRLSPARGAALRAYRSCVPHYPLAAGEGESPIYQAFTIGRMRFILTDTRSERTPKREPDGPEKTMLGSAQRRWLERELLCARDAGQVAVWVSTVPWIGEPDPAADTWAGYHHERLAIARFIEEQAITAMLMLSGDAHMAAIDDGSNNRYGPGGGAGFPVIHAGALDRSGRIKGGPYSHGAVAGGGQFGLLTVEDAGGDTIRLRASCRDYGDRELMALDWTVAVPVPGKQHTGGRTPCDVPAAR